MTVEFHSKEWSEPRKKFLILPRRFKKSYDGVSGMVWFQSVLWSTKNEYCGTVHRLAFLDKPDCWYDCSL